jgi:hypothetical protein
MSNGSLENDCTFLSSRFVSLLCVQRYGNQWYKLVLSCMGMREAWESEIKGAKWSNERCWWVEENGWACYARAFSLIFFVVFPSLKSICIHRARRATAFVRKEHNVKLLWLHDYAEGVNSMILYNSHVCVCVWREKLVWGRSFYPLFTYSAHESV